MRQIAAGVKRAFSRAAGLVRADAWMLLQQSLAATVAWLLAADLIDHRQAFFAPMAAVVALNAPLGERGSNALRLLEGVIIGIITGELALAILGTTGWALLLGTLVSLAAARAVGGTALVLAQAASASILTVATGDNHAGPNRLIDALIGGGIALVFSQILFTPEPVRLLRRAESTVLADIATAFDQAARAIDDNDLKLAGSAIDSLRDLHPKLAELARARDASQRVVRRSAVWVSQREPVVRENENAGQLDLLGASALMLLRTTTAAGEHNRRLLAPVIREFAAQVRSLAHSPGDRDVRQQAVETVLQAGRRLRSDERAPETGDRSTLAAAIVAVRAVAADILIFAGLDADQASQAIERDFADRPVPAPAPAPRLPFKGWRLPWKRPADSPGLPTNWIHTWKRRRERHAE
ncbi:hypothetical protein E0H75_07280 [Kribbella capetownensis]|uniref:Integral membrane bound transporter domain-containing protein n=1 Tax=Kribbella capetownensis TaxID=1572659 RepID=A0A4R0K409_9ACTN|nr:FUSC family protein [Kribbella capetownensis]TCC53484.1 hypothetical protein E0H75_07280 [Kribbella capetownensis]